MKAPELPRELARSHPRAVRLSTAGRWMAGATAVLSVGGLAAGIALAQAAQRDRGRLDRIRAGAVTAVAEVVERGRVRGEGRRFFATYQYTVEGRPYQGRVVFREGPLSRVAPGQPLTVAYLPSSPEASWLPGREPRGVPMGVAPLAAAGLLSIGALLARTLHRQATLLREGRPALARVTRVEQVTHHHGHAHTKAHRVHYDFRILSGALRTGKQDLTRNPPAVGSRVWIVYDREDAGRHALYPLAFVRA